MEGLTYSKDGKYLRPNLKFKQEDENGFEPIGRYGRMRQNYLKERKLDHYYYLMMTETLWPHLVKIDREALKMEDKIVSSLAEKEGINEALKASNQMEWVQAMNCFRQQAEEIIQVELIFN